MHFDNAEVLNNIIILSFWGSEYHQAFTVCLAPAMYVSPLPTQLLVHYVLQELEALPESQLTFWPSIQG